MSGFRTPRLPTSDEGYIPGRPRNPDVRGTYGDVSALLFVKTFSGDVTVGRAGADKGNVKKRD